MSKYRLMNARQVFRGGAITLANVVLAPANLLAFKAQWQSVANNLPQGGVLVVLPSASRQREALEKVADELRKIGRHVTVISAAQFAPTSNLVTTSIRRSLARDQMDKELQDKAL